MASPNPQLVAAIRRAPAHLRPILLATALVESGGRLDAVGDSGHSYGPYQMHDAGRGAGWSRQARMDPNRSTQAAVREFQEFYRRGARGADLAYRAQRPADRAGYMRKINQYLPEARRILGLTAPPPVTAPATTRLEVGADGVPTRAGGLDLGAVLREFNVAARQAQAGVAPGDDYVGRVLGLVQQAKVNTGADRTGESVTQVAQTLPAAVNPGGVVPILPGEPQWGSYGYSDPEGQGGRHLAVDWFAKGGTPFRSPVDGTVVRVTPDPTPGRRASGQVFGGTIAVRDRKGRLFVMRHSTPKPFRVGQRVTAGTVLGTVKDWAGSPHIHLETYGPGSSDREYSARYAITPRSIFNR